MSNRNYNNYYEYTWSLHRTPRVRYPQKMYALGPTWFYDIVLAPKNSYTETLTTLLSTGWDELQTGSNVVGKLHRR